MKARVCLGTVIGILALAGTVLGQQAWDTQAPPRNWQDPAGVRPGADRPDQPVVPQLPTFQRRLPAAGPAATGPRQPAAPPPPPFVLSPHDEAQLDRVLKFWEEQSGKVKTFSGSFTRLSYDPVFGNGRDPRFVDQGKIFYAAPDKGKFVVQGERQEQVVCDGKSICLYDYTNKQVIEYKVPPQLQGQAISNGPMPFLFGAKASQLKQRYYMRLTTPPGVQGQVWIQAMPKFQQDQANLSSAEVILNVADMRPIAIQVYDTGPPGQQAHKTYKFEKVAINKTDMLDSLFGGDEFRASTPYRWKRDVRDGLQGPSAAAAGPAVRPAAGGDGLGPR